MLLEGRYYKDTLGNIFFYRQGTLLKDINPTFTPVDESWVFENNLSLEDVKNQKLESFERTKHEEMSKDVEYKGFKFQNRDSDRNLLTSTVTLYLALGELPKGFVWIASDNTLVPMVLKELIELGAIMAKRVNDVTLKARFLKDATLAAKSKEEVDQIEWIE